MLTVSSIDLAGGRLAGAFDGSLRLAAVRLITLLARLLLSLLLEVL